MTPVPVPWCALIAVLSAKPRADLKVWSKYFHGSNFHGAFHLWGGWRSASLLKQRGVWGSGVQRPTSPAREVPPQPTLAGLGQSPPREPGPVNRTNEDKSCDRHHLVTCFLLPRLLLPTSEPLGQAAQTNDFCWRAGPAWKRRAGTGCEDARNNSNSFKTGGRGPHADPPLPARPGGLRPPAPSVEKSSSEGALGKRPTPREMPSRAEPNPRLRAGRRLPPGGGRGAAPARSPVPGRPFPPSVLPLPSASQNPSRNRLKRRHRLRSCGGAEAAEGARKRSGKPAVSEAGSRSLVSELPPLTPSLNTSPALEGRKSGKG